MKIEIEQVRAARAIVPLATCALLAACALLAWGCGESSSPGAGAARAQSSAQNPGAGTAAQSAARVAQNGRAAGAQAKGAGAQQASGAQTGTAVATVSGAAITGAQLQHWIEITAALSKGQRGASGHRAVIDKALGFLITEQWVFQEAAAKGVSASTSEVQKRFTEVVGERFKAPGELAHYLSGVHETEADLKARVRIELLQRKIAAEATAGKKTGAEKQAALASLQDEFERKWKARTSCAGGYSMEDCGRS